MEHYGIRQTHEALKTKLRNYITAQYFSENELLLKGTNELLDREGVIFQKPFVEATPTYKTCTDGFESAKLPTEIKSYMEKFIDAKLGVFKTPFVHQVRALESFFEGKDLLITTGTGSGKTECFIWPLMAQIMDEAISSSNTWDCEGIRALVLYPMNALVSDQLGRLRKIFGTDDDEFMNILKTLGGDHIRRPHFGMYTGRTPYAGMPDSKNDKQLAKTIKEYYIDCEEDYRNELKNIGRIPAKNLDELVNKLGKGVYTPSPCDAELFTRQEMQNLCPDIFITNYSMLEYTLMRPIEQSIWDKTKKWLILKPENKLLLVIDEAHMYRGAPGGEVSLLIRRLMNKLDINRSKLKCILTSASVPKGKENELRKFACGLTGLELDKDNFAVIRGESEEILGDIVVHLSRHFFCKS